MENTRQDTIYNKLIRLCKIILSENTVTNNTETYFSESIKHRNY